MKIGIDIGGSHMAVGLVEDDKIIMQFEKDFSENDLSDIERVIEHNIVKYIWRILKEENIKLHSIESIGIAVPRRYKRWDNDKIKQLRNRKLRNRKTIKRKAKI